MAKLALILLFAALPAVAAVPKLSHPQEQAFRSWFLEIVKAQMERGANPRWKQRDCAGLVRFAAAEAFKRHDLAWKKANGYRHQALPPEVEVDPRDFDPQRLWQEKSGKKSAYVSARNLIGRNAMFVTKDVNEARPGDLLFFDQGQDQHLMIFLGTHIAYHTGKVSKDDDGLRIATVDELMNWKDTRWQINAENSNFLGFYRFSFLAH